MAFQVVQPSISNGTSLLSHVTGKHVRKLLKDFKIWLNRLKLPNIPNALDLFHEGTLRIYRVICRIIQKGITNFIVRKGQEVVIIIGGIGESILDFVFTYFINLITFNSECYITFVYIISGGFFTKTSKSTKKKKNTQNQL